MDFTVTLADAPFELEYTLESGQVFRWENTGEWWVGQVGGSILKLKQEGDSLQCVSASEKLDTAFVRNYFRLDENLKQILPSIRKDEMMTNAIQKFYGLRLIRQDTWECLISFMLATNSNIPRIKQMITNICARFGEAFTYDGEEYRKFPTSEPLAEASVSQLEDCGLGYRAKFIKHVAKAVGEGKLDLSELSLVDYESARELLLRELLDGKLLPGVGPKVADCVLLFSCGKDEAFPIDIWIGRSLVRYYPTLIPKYDMKSIGSKSMRSLSGRLYQSISSAARAYYGKYAGYAQQYLYMYARMDDTSPHRHLTRRCQSINRA